MTYQSNSIGHITTLQTAKERQVTYHTTSIAGHKRPLPSSTSQSPAPEGQAAGKRSHPFLHPSVASREPPRLAASGIDSIVKVADTEQSEYSQRRAFPATPTPTTDPILCLSHRAYGLAPQLVANFSSLGIRSIYPWQKQCLLGPGLLRGEKNLVYSAPTGGGKSLVADILMLKRVLADADAKALLVLPYVALVQEKVRWLRNVVHGIARSGKGLQTDEDKGLWRRRADADIIRVVGFFGGCKIKATWADFDIGVCTIEKANSLVNTAIDDCSIGKLKVVVMDELHMVDDGHRGYLLELMATKLLILEQPVQIVGMSATLTNIRLLATWLRGHFYETQYRPVPIEEHLVYEGKIYAAGTTSRFLKTASQLNGAPQPSPSLPEPVRAIKPSDHKELKDSVINAVLSLAIETALAGYGALVFASSRAGCESDAIMISRAMPRLSEQDPDVLEQRMDLLGELRSLGIGLDRVLEQTVPYGVVFHHAGLTTEERDLVARAYDKGIVKVCVATCSLAAGINLPARRVILHNARMGRNLVGPSMLRQMRGRAGRKGKDEIGETYLCCRQSDLENVVELIHADLPQISSCLISDKRRIQRALLEIIAIRLATSRESINDYIQTTLLFHSADHDSLQEHVNSSLLALEHMAFVAVDHESNFQATQLGKAIVASSLDPEDGVFIHKEMKKALQAFVMDGEMHILYTFTPVQEQSVSTNWIKFRDQMERLDESGLRALTLLGMKPTVINKMAAGSIMRESSAEEKEIARIYHRFYLALQLRDICNEIPVQDVARNFDMPRGAVQTLAQSCQGFAAGMIKFCEQMGWGVMAAALDHFSDRLKAGARSDLLALAKITFVKSRTARVFWDNGFKTIAAVANADPKELVPILMQAQPNKIRLESKDGVKFEEKLFAKAKVIADSANRIWQLEMQQDIDDQL